MRAWMEVFSSAEMTYSSGRSGVSWKRRPYRSRTRAALAPKSGSRGKIQERCCQGLIASALSQRQIVVPEIEAVMPCSTAARARSGHCQRASGWGLSAFTGSSQASALMATTTSGGKTRGPSSPRQIGQAGQALVVETFAPLGDDLPRCVQACGDLVVAQAVGGVEHDLGTHNFGIR